MSEEPPKTPPSPARHTPPTSPHRPKGILKNASQNNIQTMKLTWDEENLAATEIDKDSLMKIDEPKTPYVRYNPELEPDVENEIPSLQLDGSGSGPGSSPSSPTQHSFRETVALNTAANSRPNPTSNSTPPSTTHQTLINTQANANIPADQAEQVASTPSVAEVEKETLPRRRSVSLPRGPSPDPERERESRRTSFSSRSSRSPSFSLPPDDLGRTEFREGGLGLVRAPGGDDALDDEESLDEETMAKRAEFRKMRGRHYSNEAEAMKRAQALMAQDDEDEDESEDAEMADAPPIPPLPNGRA